MIIQLSGYLNPHAMAEGELPSITFTAAAALGIRRQCSLLLGTLISIHPSSASIGAATEGLCALSLVNRRVCAFLDEMRELGCKRSLACLHASVLAYFCF